jgi:6-pyruvoyltetrahydropterin/6-carboxytetrahydropterin synthase
MTTTAIRRLQFCAGHRVLGHESKCANPHGHNYVVFLHARGIRQDLDGLGRVIDFSVLKEKIGSWIEEKWDHTSILFSEDRELIAAMERFEATKKVFIMPMNPTAENMARYLLDFVAPHQLENTGVEVFKVALWETENCLAEVTKAEGI